MLVTKLFVVGLMLANACIVPLLESVTAAMEFMAILIVGRRIIAVIRSSRRPSRLRMQPARTPIETKIAAFTALVIPISLIIQN